MMKMVMAVVPRDHSEELLQALVDAGHSATFTESRGGMLRQSQEMIFIVVEEDQVDGVLEILHGGEEGQEALTAEAEEIRKGGRVIFVWDIDRVETS